MTHVMPSPFDPPMPHAQPRAVADGDADMVAIARGDVPAQERMWRAHADSVFRVCASHLSAADAEDAVAETFIAAFATAGGYDPDRGTVRAWLLGIAVNQVRRRWRTNRRVAATVLRVAHRYGARTVTSDHADRVIARVDSRAIKPALAKLPETDRLVLVVQAAGDLTPDELAVALGTSPGAAKVRLHRARRRLAAIVDPAAFT